ncbi:outer membrane protein assembly factor BamE [Inmirania thermothiophila]|uniref:Outer membrane protein assembly factor BamE n=1 Tax=Inmirania thermothiophila TaxID=1750597 RepID=A0A3N1XZP5_9GAMM|nr:outer membrane protein assembly factor BamE [Inmirania thermothiophila]ROR32073.1 Beta-barrel assembly machine subunit BamE [Inmirania thermothiophila]
MQKLLIPLVTVLALAGCGRLVHRPDLRQGNILDPKAVAQLRAGMTEEQVRFLLGTPLVRDPFHPERWDYVELLLPGRGERQLARLTLRFRDGRLVEALRDGAPLALP